MAVKTESPLGMSVTRRAQSLTILLCETAQTQLDWIESICEHQFLSLESFAASSRFSAKVSLYLAPSISSINSNQLLCFC